MLYFLVGDGVSAKERATALSVGHEVVRFGEGGEVFGGVCGYLSSRGLFEKKVALILDQPFSDAEGALLFDEHMDTLLESETLVIVIEYSLDTKIEKKIPKSAKRENFSSSEKETDAPPNIFALTDAFLKGDRKNSWLIYRKLIGAGSAPEEIHGMLAWQARAIAMASQSKNATESGMKPFVYTKAKGAADRVGPLKSVALSRELVTMLNQSRMGMGNLGDLLEAFLLKK